MQNLERLRASRLAALRSTEILDHQHVRLPSGRQVSLGIPALPSFRREDRGQLYLDPSAFSHPHIYLARVNIRVAPRGVTQRYATFEDIVVIDGHGYRDQNQVWRFENGQPVVDTILEYNEKFAGLQGLPPIRLALVCNEDKEKHDARDTERLAHAGVIFARTGTVSVGSEREGLHAKISHSGFVDLDIKADGEFVNLESVFQQLQGARLNSLVEDNLLNHTHYG